MAKKKGQNEGTISKRADGTWWGRITVGRDDSGKQKRKAFYGKTRGEVQKKITAALNDIQNGVFVETSKMTLGQWLEIWLNEYAVNHIKHSTRVSYDHIIHNHINPVIGYIKLTDLRPDMLQKFYNDKAQSGRLDGKGGLNGKTIKNIHNMIHEALEQAHDNNMVSRNASEAVTLPKIIKREMRVLNPDEHKKVLEAADTEKYGLCIKLALATGMRIGELVALKWSDINFDDSSLRVRRNLSRLKNFDTSQNKKTVIVIAEPKTKTSKRVIPLSQNIVDELKQYKNSQDEEKSFCGEAYNENDYIFASPLGECIEPRTMQDVFKRIVKQAKITEANFHSLRHTFATRALEAGVPAKVVSEILGHANVSTTLDLYSHVSLDTKRDAINKIDEYLSS